MLNHWYRVHALQHLPWPKYISCQLICQHTIWCWWPCHHDFTHSGHDINPKQCDCTLQARAVTVQAHRTLFAQTWCFYDVVSSHIQHAWSYQLLVENWNPPVLPTLNPHMLNPGLCSHLAALLTCETVQQHKPTDINSLAVAPLLSPAAHSSRQTATVAPLHQCRGGLSVQACPATGTQQHSYLTVQVHLPHMLNQSHLQWDEVMVDANNCPSTDITVR